jgi:hypothetical protein
MTTLQPQKQKFIYRCQGVLGPKAMLQVALNLIAFIGMTPARRGRVDRYPYQGGGGKGFTLFQPLKESYLVIDVYDNVNESEVLISTCKPERLHDESVKSFLAKEIGPII